MKNINNRNFLEFAVLVVVLGLIGYFIHYKFAQQINAVIEENVLRHIGTVAYSVENTLNRNLRELHVIARTIEKGKLPVENFVSISRAFREKAYKSGLIRSNGLPIAADENHIDLSWDEFVAIQNVFKGEDVVAYFGENGIIFAVPVTIDGEVCGLYQHCPKDGTMELFRVISYNGLGRITLANLKGEWMEISDAGKNNAIYDELFTLPDFTGKFTLSLVQSILQNGKSVAEYSHNGQKFMCFGSKIYNNQLVIFGLVTKEVVAIGVEYIHIILLAVVLLICIILMTFSRAALKSAENKELQVEKDAALQASKTKSEFLSNMSHEIRTPINAILGMNEMILREAKDKNILEYAENVKNAGNNLLGIVNDILDFSKIEAGKMEIIPVEYELASLLNDLVNMIQKRAENKGLQFIVVADKSLPTVLFGDEIRIKQVVTNILTNAVKYTEQGFVVLRVEPIQKFSKSLMIRFSIKDTGIGIKPEDIAKLFNAFERIEEKRNRTIEGTGLGMNITQSLLMMMGSDLKVESVYGEGSTFYFDIEQNIINPEPMGDFAENFRRSLQQHKEYHQKFTAPDAKILIVDDTVMNLTVVKGLLKQTKIQIDTSESGIDALELVQKNHYDIIFLDHRMPKMDGVETLQKMKILPNNLNQNTPVISLTANAISGAREQYIAAGFQDYLTKPINSIKLEEMIMKYLPAEKVSVSDENSAETVEENLNLPDWLAQIDGLNAREGVEHCGDIDSYLDALKVFANSISAASDEIENFFNNKDWKNYTTKVHALKSSARVIGASELSERARRLEDAGNSGYIEEIKQDTMPLLTLYRSYTEKLSMLIEVKAEENNSDKPLIEEENLAEAFDAMNDAAVNFDIDTIEFVLQSLEEYQLPQAEFERCKKLKNAVAKLDWDLIKEILKCN